MNRYTVYDADDKPLATLPVKRPISRAEAKRVATEHKTLVFVYGDNGRESIEPAPSVGLGCTICYYTDRKAATVVAVSPSGHRVVAREDIAIRADTNGMSETQHYDYQRNADGTDHVFYRQGDGSYADSRGGKRLTLGVRRSYHDYSY